MGPELARRSVLVAAAAAGLAPGRLLAEPEAEPTAPAEPAAEAPSQDLKLAQDTTSRLTLGVMVDGQGPFDFLVDTGSNRTLVSRELAALLKLPPGPVVTVHETAGVDRLQTVMIDRLQIGERTLRRIAAPAVGGGDLGAAGLLGVDCLKDLHLVVDFTTLSLTTSPSREEAATAGTVVVRGRSRFGQLILADAEVQGVKVFMVVDTGSDISVGNLALLTLLTARSAALPSGQVTIVSATGRVSTAELHIIPQATLGNLSIRGMPLAFAQQHIFDYLRLVKEPAILLGMDVLRLCRRITVDIRRRQASFTVPDPA